MKYMQLSDLGHESTVNQVKRGYIFLYPCSIKILDVDKSWGNRAEIFSQLLILQEFLLFLFFSDTKLIICGFGAKL